MPGANSGGQGQPALLEQFDQGLQSLSFCVYIHNILTLLERLVQDLL